MRCALTFILAAITIVAARASSAATFDRLVGATSESGGAYVVKRFQIPRGSVVAGVEFYSNDLRTTFPEVLILQGPATSISGANVLARSTGVGSPGQHRILVNSPRLPVARVMEIYVAIELPPSSGVRGLRDGAGIGATSQGLPGNSFFACDSRAAFGPMDVDYSIRLVLETIGKPEQAEKTVPRTFLDRPSPNPASGTTAITFGLGRTAPVALGVYDVAGRLVRTILQESLHPGVYLRVWDGRNETGQHAAAGVYILRLRAGEQVLVQKVVMSQ